MREIIIDTETTGLSPEGSHRMVEIACVELINHVRTGRHFHRYINPLRDVPEEAFKIHGLSYEFLKDFTPFPHVAEEMIAFIDGSPLVIHNAAFDLKFLNYELKAAGLVTLEGLDCIDTLKLARSTFPGAQVSLDALCRRFKIDLSRRSKHGALLDAELLADVYLELKGGKQTVLTFSTHQTASGSSSSSFKKEKKPRPYRKFPLPLEEKALHKEFLKQIPTSLWE